MYLRMIRVSFRRLIILSILGAFIIPVSAFAQSASSTATTTDDGSLIPARQRWRESRQRSSEMQQKISALGSAVEQLIAIPILFGVVPGDFTLNFGDPRGGGTRSHEGQDIMAVKGTPIVSPTPAVVLRMSNGINEGITVTTANPGGETFVYMHLDRYAEGLAEGIVLAKGDLIGYVGNTGNAINAGAHLHFEIHDSNGAVTNPYPRLAIEFSSAEKMQYLQKILGQASDPITFSRFLASNFRNTFTAAQSAAVLIPPLISGALDTTPNSPATIPALPTGDLRLGSRGTAVTALQQFLISKASGQAAAKLAAAGATGNFGAITQSALIEFQIAAGIAPSDGYYGAATRLLVESQITQQNTNAPSVPAVPATSAAFTRDLRVGMTGEDVFALQRYLNAHGFIVAASGSGSVGNETMYFGPATRAALIRFQEAHAAQILVPAGLAAGTGYFGPSTRTFINSH